MSDQVIRVEDWRRYEDLMTNTVEVQVREGERVRVVDHYVEEFGFRDPLDRGHGFHVFSYDHVRLRLLNEGWHLHDDQS